MKVNKRVTNVSYLGNNEIHIKHKSTQSVCNSSPNSDELRLLCYLCVSLFPGCITFRPIKYVP